MSENPDIVCLLPVCVKHTMSALVTQYVRNHTYCATSRHILCHGRIVTSHSMSQNRHSMSPRSLKPHIVCLFFCIPCVINVTYYDVCMTYYVILAFLMIGKNRLKTTIVGVNAPLLWIK